MNNIKSRIDNVNFQRENFGYDNLNRLLEVHHGYLNQQLLGLVQSMNYDNLGNITFKTDVGNMQYSPTHPFQMEMLTENPQTITSEHVLEYFVSGRTKTIEDNDKKLQFTYGSDLQRRKMEYFLENQLQSTTLYPFGNYEEVHNATTNDVLKYNYIGSPDGLIAIRKTTNGTSQLYYTLTDHLGSIDALCDENGSVVERYSYDVWGNRRNPSDWTLADARIAWITTRGFTGHEHLDKFGLINANARMYEPLTGKFLAPDPYVQAPDYSQSFNRYTYCWNNPLKYTDPSGHVALNPWYEYQAGPKTKFYTWMPEFYEEYLDNQGRNWKYHGETINTPGFYGDETGMWISKLNEHNELIYNYNELRQIVQNNANSNSFFSSFSMGAGVFRVEGEGGGSKNNTTNTTGSSGNPVQTVSDVNNYFGIVISAVDQVLKNTKFGANFAYAISGNSNLVSVVNNGLKFAPYAGLGVTIYTGTLLSRTINPATNQPYQSWFETGTDIGANLGIIYIGTQFGGWWGAGAAAVYLLDKAAFKAYIEECKKGTYEGIPKYRR